MRLGMIAFAGILGFALNVQAEENVWVDLSVLDGLNTTYSAPTEPLFPVLPKREPKPVLPKATSPKKPKSEEISLPAPKADVTKSSKVTVKETPAVKETVVMQESKEAVAKQEDDADVVVVDVEPTSPDAPGAIPVADVAPLPQEAATDAADTSPAKPNSNSDLPAVSQPAAPEVSDVQETKPALLIDNTLPTEEQPSAIDNTIKFAPEVDTLSSEQMAKINTIISTFKDAKNNKIAIYSYNQDDGTDSFKKKRISLNRAIEIRSYLIKQGYKNFSIKVVNINSDSAKADMVELAEM